MLIWDYDPKTRELIGNPAGRPAREDPLEPGRYLVPALATTVAPPPAEAGKTAVFDPEAGTWSLVADHRGRTYYNPAGGIPLPIRELGAEPPEGWPDTPPPAGLAAPSWDGEKWTGDLALAQKLRYRELERASDAYLAARGYSPGWLVKAMEARYLAQELLDDPEATDEQKAAAAAALERFKELRTWMMGTVRAYFAAQAQAIYAAQSIEELDGVTWDYTTLDASDPRVRLGTEIYPKLDQAGAAAKLTPTPAP